MKLKGIILAGGTGTRLGPVTLAVNKHVLPVYDKPMIYYSLSLLMLAGLTNVGIVSSPLGLNQLKRLLGDGSQIGICITYIEQSSPGGIPHALICAKDFVCSDDVMVVLGDNFLFADNLAKRLRDFQKSFSSGCKVYLHNVKDAERFGVAKVDKGRVNLFVEKPKNFVSNLAVTGIYLFDARLIDICENLIPSARGEVEIIDVLNTYLEAGEAFHEILGRGVIWWDLGTSHSLLQASKFVELTQQYDKRTLANIFEISLNNNWTTEKAIKISLSPYEGHFSKLYGQD